MAPARLTLAETARVCGIEHEPFYGQATWLERALGDARASAHNIQDTAFCVRTTARVNAMRFRWWQPGGVNNLHKLVVEFAENPAAEPYAALHVIGEAYRFATWRTTR